MTIVSRQLRSTHLSSNMNALIIISLAIYLAYFTCRAEKLQKSDRILAKNKWDKNGFIAYCPCMGK